MLRVGEVHDRGRRVDEEVEEVDRFLHEIYLYKRRVVRASRAVVVVDGKCGQILE